MVSNWQEFNSTRSYIKYTGFRIIYQPILGDHIRTRCSGCAGALQQTLAAVAVGRVSIKGTNVSIKGHVSRIKG